MYESVCVPDLGDFLGYQSGAHQGATPEHKSPATPASSATSNSSGPQTGNQATAPLQPPSAAVSLPSRQYHNDGKCLSHFIYPLLQFPYLLSIYTWKNRWYSFAWTKRKIYRVKCSFTKTRETNVVPKCRLIEVNGCVARVVARKEIRKGSTRSDKLKGLEAWYTTSSFVLRRFSSVV